MASINNIENAYKTRGKGLLQYTSNSCRKNLPLNLDSIWDEQFFYIAKNMVELMCHKV